MDEVFLAGEIEETSKNVVLVRRVIMCYLPGLVTKETRT